MMTITNMNEMSEYNYGYAKAKLDAINAIITSPLLTYDSERTKAIKAILFDKDDMEDLEIEE